jgi:hypothetical protein
MRYLDQITIEAASGLLVRTAPASAPASHSRESVPLAPPALRPLFLELAHGAGANGHLGASKTLDVLLRSVWWPSCRASVDSFCAGCECVLRRSRHTPVRNHVPLQQFPATATNDVVAADVAGPWPLCYGFQHVLVVSCLFSRFTLLFPLV